MNKVDEFVGLKKLLGKRKLLLRRQQNKNHKQGKRIQLMKMM